MDKTNKPKFITFTGVDARTDLQACYDISKAYPVEFGFLVSDVNASPRYTGMDRLIEASALGLKVALHLCGNSARTALTQETYGGIPRNVNRIQVNARSDLYKMEALARLGSQAPTIIQSRDSKEFPILPMGVLPLFDRSGGRGERPQEWPRPPADSWVGYAGGFDARSSKKFVKKMQGTPYNVNYWIDMESNVRTPEDWFSPALCLEVCQAVYG